MHPHVLVVSRSVETGTRLQARAVQAGFRVSVARTEEAALREVRRQPVDAVLCTVAGQGTRALALLERLREEESDACVIMVGPDLRAARVAAFLRAGAFDYLTTPLRRGRLERSLREGLDIRRSFMQVRDLSDTLKRMNEELARDRDRLRQWNRNLGLLNQLGQAISGSLNADEIVKTVGPRLGQMLEFDLMGIVWLQPERVWVHAPASQSAAPQDDPAAQEARQFLQARGRCLVALDQATARVVPVPGRDVGPLGRPVEVLDVPLLIANQPVGLLHVQRRAGRPFAADEAELAKAVAMSLALALRNADAHSQVQKLALRDGLTGLLNRRALANILARKFSETERYGTPLCLVMADIDHFKTLNDRLGHLAGDHLLKEIAALFSRSVRAVDVVARYGGEEFAIILPRTDLVQALILANRVRETVAQHPFTVEGHCVALSVSMGVARIPDPNIRTMEQLVAMADRTLYQAKAQGRNRVEAPDEVALLAAPSGLAGKAGVEKVGGRC